MTPQQEKALQDFVAYGTGLSDDKVFWQDGNPRPAAPYVAMLIANDDNPSNDETTWERNPSPTTGDEVIHRARNQLRCELQLQCFAPAAAGVNTARALLRKLITGASLPTQKQRLNAAGIGAIGFEQIQVTPAIQNAVVFEPRAVVVFAFNIVEEAIETGTNIATVEVTATINGVAKPTQTVSVDD